MEKLPEYFGHAFTSDERKTSYDFIESFIENNVLDWAVAPDTDLLAGLFAGEVKNLDMGSFAFLLCHSGYIPEYYAHDSSQETLYSKLIEVLVCEWAVRVGFVHSQLQKQKSSKEDVTIRFENIVIVSDAKSFRLGRSQAAPNVKDVIKKADYEKWKSNWVNADPDPKWGKPIPVGGLIVFPSQHRWKKCSDAYLYSTDKHDPVVILFYEHLAFFLIRGYGHQTLVDAMKEYAKLFPEQSNEQHTYFEKVIGFMFGRDKDTFFEFQKLFAEIIREKVQHTIAVTEDRLDRAKKQIKADVADLPEDALRAAVIEARIGWMWSQIGGQIENIKKFRSA